MPLILIFCYGSAKAAQILRKQNHSKTIATIQQTHSKNTAVKKTNGGEVVSGKPLRGIKNNDGGRPDATKSFLSEAAKNRIIFF